MPPSGHNDITIEVFGKTDVGLVREHNEDNYLVADVTGAVRAADARAPFSFPLGDKGALLLVCDGMGGAAAGEVASQMAVDAIYDALATAEPLPRDPFARLVRRAVQQANIILQALGVQERVEVVLSQVQLRKGDVALLCSDGLHGPVTDEEILAVLIGEQDLQKAGESLIGKALDRDGPDNITVVLARFDGEGLTAPMPEDLVGFVGYDPGGDPVPEPVP